VAKEYQGTGNKSTYWFSLASLLLASSTSGRPERLSTSAQFDISSHRGLSFPTVGRGKSGAMNAYSATIAEKEFLIFLSTPPCFECNISLLSRRLCGQLEEVAR
jgi:hypothetical protein